MLSPCDCVHPVSTAQTRPEMGICHPRTCHKTRPNSIDFPEPEPPVKNDVTEKLAKDDSFGKPVDPGNVASYCHCVCQTGFIHIIMTSQQGSHASWYPLHYVIEASLSLSEGFDQHQENNVFTIV